MFRDIHEFEAPPHPGEVLRAHLLPAYGLSQRALAKHLKMSRWLVGEVIRERRAVTPELAAALGAAFGQGPQYWLSLQLQHDLFKARATVESRVAPLVRIGREADQGGAPKRPVITARSPGFRHVAVA